jgi:hypothetical protein
MSAPIVIAKPVSRVLNPFFINIMALLVATYAETNNLRDFGIWTLIILFFTVIVPFAYIYARSSRKVSSNRKMPELLSSLKERRKEIWALVIIAGVPFVSLLIILKAPTILIATLVALLGSCLAIALVNRFFKASYHISSITILAITAVVVWGQAALPALFIIPLVGWARYCLQQHSPGQLAAGFGLSLVVAAGTLYSFGSLGTITI